MGLRSAGPAARRDSGCAGGAPGDRHPASGGIVRRLRDRRRPRRAARGVDRPRPHRRSAHAGVHYPAVPVREHSRPARGAPGQPSRGALPPHRRVRSGAADGCRPPYLLGVAYASQGRASLGIGYLERSVQLAPRHASHWVGLGHGYREVGRRRDAEAAYLARDRASSPGRSKRAWRWPPSCWTRGTPPERWRSQKPRSAWTRGTPGPSTWRPERKPPRVADYAPARAPGYTPANAGCHHTG